MEESRDGYKENMNEIMDGRNKYRESIEGRKVKESALIELISQDKADITQLKAAIDAAVEFKVKESYIKRARKFLVLMEYTKEFEQHL